MSHLPSDGWPETLCVPSGPIVGLCALPHHMAVLTSDTVFLFTSTASNTVLVGQAKRNAEHCTALGENKSCLYNAVSHTIVVQTSRALLVLYIHPLDEVVLESTLSSSTHVQHTVLDLEYNHTVHCADREEARSLFLFRHLICRLCPGGRLYFLDPVTGKQALLQLCTRDASPLDCLHAILVDLTLFCTTHDALHVVILPTAPMETWLDPAFTTQKHPLASAPLSAGPTCLDAVTTAHGMHVAVGLSDGHVQTWVIDLWSDKAIQRPLQWSMHQFDVFDRVGSVSSVAWSNDGHSMITGFQEQGCALVSKEASLLWSSMTPSITSSKYALVNRGTVCTAWTRSSTSAWIASSQSIARLALDRHVPNEDTLIGTQTLRIYNPDARALESIPIPATSMPPHLVATCTRKVAVASATRLAVVDRITASWTWFDDVMTVAFITSLAWIGNAMLAVGKEDGKMYLFFLDVHDTLSFVHVLGKEEMDAVLQIHVSEQPRRPNVYSVTLLYPTTLLRYRIEIQVNQTAKDRFKPIEAADAVCIPVMQCMTSLRHPASQSTQVRSIWIDGHVMTVVNEYDVVLYDTEGSSAVLCTGRQRIWTTSSFPSIWTYGNECGLQIWMRHQPQKQPTDASLCPLQCIKETTFGPFVAVSAFSFSREVHMFTIDERHLNMIGLQATCGSYHVQHVRSGHQSILQMQAQTCLDAVLRYYIMSESIRDVVTFASPFVTSDYFFFARELLLHTMMEMDLGQRQQSEWLPQTVAFLNHYDDILDIVASCARKTDFCHWGRLFTLTHDPVTCFDMCLAQKQVETAAKYLMIVQRSAGATEAFSCANRLLSLIQSDPDIRVSEQFQHELKRFTHMVHRRSDSHPELDDGAQHLASQLGRIPLHCSTSTPFDTLPTPRSVSIRPDIPTDTLGFVRWLFGFE